jgi:hypothetical protein
MSNRTEETSWQAPPFESSTDRRIGFAEEQIQEGEGLLSGQKCYKNFGRNMKIFEGVFSDKTKSTLNSNFLRYNLRKFVETISDVREIGLFGSDAQQFKQYCEMLNKVAKGVYLESQYPRQLRKALQWATMGPGYLWPKCKASDYGWGERKIVFEPLGMLDVLPVQVPSSGDVQEAYLMTVFQYMPIAEAHARFPLFQSQLRPIDQSRFDSRVSAKRVDFAEKFRYGEERNFGNLYCEIRYQFIRDMRINNTGYEIPMGDFGTSWFYKVPFIGQDILGGVRGGEKFMRKATKEDCRVYPRLRLMITSAGIPMPMYDGPAFDWHGMMPPVQYVCDDWPWEAFGVSLIDSVGSIEMTKRKHERNFDQVLSTKMDPPMGYDRSSAGGPKIENWDLFGTDNRVGVDGKPKDILQSLFPDDVDVREVNFKFHELLQKMEKEQLGLDDLSSLMNLKMNISSESFDKALESIGPIAKGIAASMEASNARVAQQIKFLILQYFDTNRIMQYTGPTSVDPEIMDFDPTSIVPSHGEDEYVGNMLPTRVLGDGSAEVVPSFYSKIERAQRFAKNLRVISIPSTLLKITQMQEQTKYLALFGRGFPISPHTCAKKWGIENYGDIEGDTEFQKWVNWKKLEILLMAQAKALATEVMPEEPGNPKETGKQHGGGRPPSDQKGAKLKVKDKSSNPRPVVSTSG